MHCGACQWYQHEDPEVFLLLRSDYLMPQASHVMTETVYEVSLAMLCNISGFSAGDLVLEGESLGKVRRYASQSLEFLQDISQYAPDRWMRRIESRKDRYHPAHNTAVMDQAAIAELVGTMSMLSVLSPSGVPFPMSPKAPEPGRPLLSGSRRTFQGLVISWYSEKTIKGLHPMELSRQ